MAPKLSRLKQETTGLKLFPLFTLMGWGLIGFSILILVLVISPVGSSYWGGNAKPPEMPPRSEPVCWASSPHWPGGPG